MAQDVIITLSAPQHVGACELHAVDTCETGCTGEWIAEDVKIAYGGVAPKTIMAPKVHAAIKGQPWTGATLKNALEAVAQDVNITPNAPGTDPASSLRHIVDITCIWQVCLAQDLESLAQGVRRCSCASCLCI